jgi:acyl-CoA reductase-like NAD-dependent aldehyde dehydrogenase
LGRSRIACNKFGLSYCTSQPWVSTLKHFGRYEKVKDMYSEIGKRSWKTAFGGEIKEASKGYYITPAIIDNPPDDSRIVVEEPFGPIIPMLKWSDEQDVLARANSDKTGLGTSVWIWSAEREWRGSCLLEASGLTRTSMLRRMYRLVGISGVGLGASGG